jgi:putative oxidoreductase
MQRTRERIASPMDTTTSGLQARFGALSGLGLLVLRGVVGVVMAYHGWEKVTGGVENFAGFLESLSVPFPGLMAYVVTGLELGGGILLAVGLLTRLWGLLIAIEMVFTTILVKVDLGLIAPETAGAELDLLILAGCLMLVLIGPGAISLDRALGLERSATVRV